MSAIIVLHGGERVRVALDYRDVVSALERDDSDDTRDTFAFFKTENSYNGDPRVAVNVDAVVAVIQA